MEDFADRAGGRCGHCPSHPGAEDFSLLFRIGAETGGHPGAAFAGLEAYTEEKTYPAEFDARVFKIARDEQAQD